MAHTSRHQSVALPAVPPVERESIRQRIGALLEVSADQIQRRPEFNALVGEVCGAYQRYEKSSIEELDFLLCYAAKRIDQIESIPVQTAQVELGLFLGR